MDRRKSFSECTRKNRRVSSLIQVFNQRMLLDDINESKGRKGSTTEDHEPSSWATLRELCNMSLEHFALLQDEVDLKIKDALHALLDTLDDLKPIYLRLSRIAPLFDFDEKTPGNGYRSFLNMVDSCILYANTTCRDMFDHKYNVLFRKYYHMLEIEACSQMFTTITKCLRLVDSLCSGQEGDCSLLSDQQKPGELIQEAININKQNFYGRGLGFQFRGRLKTIMKLITIIMTSFSELFYSNNSFYEICTNAVRYVLNPEARSSRMIDIAHHADISFSQAFWNLTEGELAAGLRQLIMPSLAVNEVISIPPEEMKYIALNGSTIKIPVPKSHIGPKPLQVRLLSSKLRHGMVGSKNANGNLADESDELMIHCHGGGFVSQSSRSHECYLRTWSTELDIPILSIDYSLAPEAPYPRAVEEVLYAYVWALKNADSLLGSTAKKIVFVGDSAGANLMLVTALRCLEMDIRLPTGIFIAYATTLVDVVLTPSRLLSLVDPVLPFGFMMRCLKAYADTESCETNFMDEFLELNKPFIEDSEDSNFLTVSSALDGDAGSRRSSSASLNNAPINGKRRNSRVRLSIPILETLNINSPTSANNSNTNDTKPPSLLGWVKDKTERYLNTNTDLNSDEFLFAVPKDYYLSPYKAPDELLKRFPPVKIVSTHADPLLDDCVIFAKKLKVLGKPVSLDILNGLPHAFLNLVAASQEAHEASLLCGHRIRELLDM